MEPLSDRISLHAPDGAARLDALQRASAPRKALLSEHGWVFLIGDTNDNLKVQFGLRRWSADERRSAAEIVGERIRLLRARGVSYRKVIVPEKAVIYRDYLPNALRGLVTSDERPACCLQRDHPDMAAYPAAYLRDARSYGLLYFRADTHLNWVGAWFLYHGIVAGLIDAGLALGPRPLPFAALQPSLASFDGDLVDHMADEMRAKQEATWGFTNARYGVEIAVRLTLEEERRSARRVDVPEHYRAWFSEHEPLAYERSDRAGPRAVIIRDSTLELCHELIAEHFSRSVFVWRHGLVFEELIAQEQPDIVLHVMAERFVLTYPLHPPLAAFTSAIPDPTHSPAI